MNLSALLFLTILLIFSSLMNSFTISSTLSLPRTTISKSLPSTSSSERKRFNLVMGNNAKFGIFSPAVYAAKLVLGDAKLNKFRGKVISLHSQAITDWCIQYGAYNLRTRLIKMAKSNGDRLGFLV